MRRCTSVALFLPGSHVCGTFPYGWGNATYHVPGELEIEKKHTIFFVIWTDFLESIGLKVNSFPWALLGVHSFL